MDSHWIGETGERALAAVERQHWLDPLGQRVESALAFGFRLLGPLGQHAQNLLHGTWLGHPLHPALTDIPIGAWTAAMVLDAIESSAGRPRALRRGYGKAADHAIVLGVLGALGSAATGLTDWQYTHEKSRRAGLVHGMVNTAALLCYGSSLFLRRRGRRKEGKIVSSIGYAAVLAGAYVGGRLVFRHRIGTDHADDRPKPHDFVPVLSEAELEEGKPRKVEAEGVGVVLVRKDGQIYALGDACSHLGGPLSEGWLKGDGLVCPWHGSRFALEDGHVIDGPATLPQPGFETRVKDGRIEVRHAHLPKKRRLAIAKVERTRLPSAVGKGPSPSAERPMEATRLLTWHHEVMRSLVGEMKKTAREDAKERRAIAHQLSEELLIHMQIEEELFYPAVREVTDLVPEAFAEHRRLGDLIAELSGKDPSSEAFEETFEALHAALEFHAGEEERQMFPDAHKLGHKEMLRLGRALFQRKEELHTSMASCAKRAAELAVFKAV